MRRGCLITLEGPEGSGKTHLAKRIGERFREMGLRHSCYREPGTTDIGLQIRQVLHDLKNINMCARTELLLYLASRAQLVEEKIKPALLQGEIVLLDRYGDSSRVYQGIARGLGLDRVTQLNDFATEGLRPDLTILIDVDTEVGLERKKYQGEWNRLDGEQVEFHRKVRAGYLSLSQESGRKWVIVKNDSTLEVLESRVWGEVSSFLAGRGFIELEHSRPERRG